MKAVWNDIAIAEAPKEDLIYIERNWYFPPASVKKDFSNYMAFWRDVTVVE
jgi:uncharacterized protein (DUF427 family)